MRTFHFQVESEPDIHTIELSEDITCSDFISSICSHFSRPTLTEIWLSGANCGGEDLVTDFLESDSDVIIVSESDWTPGTPSLTSVQLFTTANIESLTQGIQLPCTWKSSRDEVLSAVRRILPKGMDADLYLPGAVPWHRGTLGPYLRLLKGVRPNVYAVVYRERLAGVTKSLSFFDRETVTSPLHALFGPIAPVPDSSPLLCALGYIRLGGIRSDCLISSFAHYIHFGPLIVGLHRLYAGIPIDGHWLVAITSSLQTLFGAFFGVPPERAFERVLDGFAYMSMQYHAVGTVNVLETRSDQLKAFSDESQEGRTILWRKDVDPESRFGMGYWSRPDDADLVQARGQTPFMAPTTRLAICRRSAPFITGPLIGLVCAQNVFFDAGPRRWKFYPFECPFKASGPTARDTESSIPRSRVSQIVMVLLDVTLLGRSKDPLVRSFVSAFENEIFRFRSSTLVGVVASDGQIIASSPIGTVRQSLFPELPSKPHEHFTSASLVDAVARLVSFAHDASGPCSPRARMRLIVVSDFRRSSSPRIDYSFFRESGVIVDALLFKTDLGWRRSLIELCHMTGGAAVPINTEEELRGAVQSEAFLSIDLRAVKVTSGGQTDSEFPNAMISRGAERAVMRTAGAVARTPPRMSGNRIRRIMQELQYAAGGSEEVQVFGTDLVEEWRAFLRGPEGTPYAGKWWYIVVKFGESYPVQPPVFRFISVPFHVNVSAEGRICLNLLEKEYQTNVCVYELLIAIVTLLAVPNYEDPIDAEKARLAKTDRGAFQTRAIASRRNAKDSVEEWMAQLEAP
jgi:ubiquitin-protein ligase